MRALLPLRTDGRRSASRKRRRPPSLVRLGSLLGPAVFLSCGDGTGPDARTGSLAVSVVVEGWALPDVDVRASGPGGQASANSGGEGVAFFPELPPGTYTLTLEGVDADARLDEPAEAVVGQGELTEVLIGGSFDPGRFVDVRVGGTFRCALNEHGNAYCWGLGTVGELGNGGTGPSSRPVRVRVPVGLTALAAGTLHACGLGSGGHVYCWGSNVGGRLGRDVSGSELTHSGTPARVEGGVRFGAIDALDTATCGIELGSGQAYCWGSAQWGALGSSGGAVARPRRVASVESFETVTSNDAWSGFQSVAALTDDGRVFFWGAVRSDGEPSWMSFAGPAPTEIPLPMAARAVTPACAVLVDDRVLCWPDLERDVPPEVRERLVPTSEPGLHEFLVEGIDEAFFRAGLPCRREAAGYVCLQDWFLELPPLAFGGETAVAVSSRGYSGCTVTEAGRVWCWSELTFEPAVEAGPEL